MGHPVDKIDAAVIRRTLEELEISAADFAAEARVAPSSVYSWLRRGHAPAQMELVCEALRARRAKVGSRGPHEVMMLTRVPESEVDVVRRFLRAIGGRGHIIQ